MATTTTTSLANAIQTFFQRRLLSVFRKEMKYQDFAFQRRLTNANTTRFVRVEKIARASQGSEGTPPTPTALSTNYLECTLEEYKVAIQPTDWAIHDMFTGDVVKIASDRIGLSMAEAADYRVAKEIAKHSWRVRQGLNPALKAKGTASSGSTTTLVCSTLAGSFSDDDFNGSVLLVYEGTNKGLARPVADFTGSTCTFDFTGDAFPQAIDTTSKFIVYSIKNMDSSFKIDSDSIRKMSAIAKSRGMKKINGSIMCIMPHMVHADFFEDPVFKEQSINIPNMRFQNDVIGKWFNWMFIGTDQPWIEDSSGDEDESSGSRVPVPVIGANSYSIARRSTGKGKFGMKTFIVNEPDHTNMDMSYTSLAANMRFIPCVVNAEWINTLYCAYNSYF